MIVVLLATVLAVAPPGVEPAVVAYDVVDQYAAWASEQRESPPPLACRALWASHARLCFRVVERRKRRWITEADLEAWHTDLASLEAVAVSALRERAEQLLVQRAVGGDPRTYLAADDGSAWASAMVLVPDFVAARLGAAALHVAVPAEGTFLAWAPDDPELDRIMAIGVTELHLAAGVPVTATCFRWDKSGWRPFATAVPR